MSTLRRVTATGDVVTGAVPRRLLSAVLTPAAAVATLDLRDASAGAVLLSLQAAASGTSASWSAGDGQGVLFSGGGFHATISGAGASATIETT